MTPEEVHHEMTVAIREVRVELRELRVDMREQFGRIKILIWLPVITGAMQIALAIFQTLKR